MGHDGVSGNEILASLSPDDRAAIRQQGQVVHYAAGGEIVRSGEIISTVFFPDHGVVSVVNVLSTGQNAAVAAVGREGMIGAGVVLHVKRASSWTWAIAQVETSGLSLPSDVFVRLFQELRPLRELTLAHVGRVMLDISRSATCSRFHSHRQRLARWLIEMSRKSGCQLLPLTHDSVAQIVGGPRHAVTTALGELRSSGVIEYLRGDVTIIDPERLLTFACECCERE